MKLSEVIDSRDNNFNLIRLAAAWMVLMSHSHDIVTGNPASAPLYSWIGMTPGSIAVDIFFFASGMLVTSSLVRRHDIADFLRARAARIYPAMWVMTLATQVYFGSEVTPLPPSSFLAQPDTWTYVWKNLTIAAGVYGRLPEVFSTNPLAGQINGSLWTLKFEVWMYGLLALLGLLSRPLLLRGVNLLPPACIALAVIGLAQHLRVYLTEHVVDERFRLLGMFFLGSAALHLRSRLVLDWRALALLGAVLLAASGQSGAFRLFYPFVIGYLVLVLAYRPRGRILQFNRLGDFSYGLYIYAFPVQQTLMLYFPALTIAQHVACSTVVTSGLAIASWFLIEKPALDWNRESARTRRRAATGAAPYRGLQPTLAGPAASSVDESPPDAATR